MAIKEILLETKYVRIENILVVRHFPNVFLDNFPKVPLEREVKFIIELMLGTSPISRAPYCMTPMDFNELKMQLEEMLEKSIVRHNVSP